MDHESPIATEQQVCVDIISKEAEGSLNPGSVENHHLMISVDDAVDPLNAINPEENIIIKEKRKKASSAKKPPKPPRPHRGFSLDAADQKLIKELAELAVIKRARIERMKALMMQKKASKASSCGYSSLFAMIFTIIVFIVLLFQGMSCQISCGTFEASPHETNESGLIFIHEELNPSAYDSV